MNNNEKINVIIPCYYEDFYLDRCLTSLANQTYRNRLKIYIINDCSPNTTTEYSGTINSFKDKLDITYLKTERNSGPGVARQLGLDSIDNDYQYVMFIDDDDRLYDSKVIEKLYEIINKKDYAAINGPRESTLGQDGLLFTGSLLNRNIINKFNLRFLDKISYYEEDSEFIATFFITVVLENERYHMEKYEIYFPDFIVYEYTSVDNPNSLTSIATEEHSIRNHNLMRESLIIKMLNVKEDCYFMRHLLNLEFQGDGKEKYPDLYQKYLSKYGLKGE